VDENELAYIGLGANLGPARRTLARAVVELRSLPGASWEGVSRLYRTRPVGPVAEGSVLNAAAALRVPAGADAERGAMALLLALKAIERSLGREVRERWGPREIDLDLLLFGAHRLHVERDEGARSDDRSRSGPQWLEVPHPAARERLFVLAPLADLAPTLRPPGWAMSVAEARDHAEAREGRAAVSAIGTWDEERETWTDHAEPAAGLGRRPDPGASP
jgi:2-amino-4-hydroxy-6-hydroxymethyldihydropteridine diphosphokinase